MLKNRRKNRIAGEFAVRLPFAGGLAAFFVENELDAAAIGERLDEH